ncbi:MAG: hypothetical protein WBZ33_15605, partial [Thermoactinomyces sp.]
MKIIKSGGENGNNGLKTDGKPSFAVIMHNGQMSRRWLDEGVIHYQSISIFKGETMYSCSNAYAKRY